MDKVAVKASKPMRPSKGSLRGVELETCIVQQVLPSTRRLLPSTVEVPTNHHVDIPLQGK